ncbi:MAG: 50S ribosomal protein L25, partial [Armatimonadetes bacterium]|nr:50S ribosomal protein L25 [Armatimonadota bacterium]
VPLVTVGEARGTTEDEGVLEQHLYEVTVRCLPTEIPDRLELDITEMVIGDTLHISDVPTPEGVEIVNDPEEAVISCLAPRIVEEEEPEAAEEVEGELAEGEEAAEGEAAEGEGEAGEGEGGEGEES